MKLASIFNPLGIILVALGIIMLTPISVALLAREYGSILPFVVACGVSVALGLILQWRGGFSRDFDELRRSEGMLIVSLAWVVTGAIGGIPYLFYDLGPIDAYFESISGFTTTGATILKDFAPYPKTFFFWRSLSQWLGGMGIIVLFVAVLPQFAVAGRQMFFAEAPGPTEEKVTPRITHTAKALWLVYILLTVLEVILLRVAGMPLFDAVCNAFSTLAAGGFSPHPQSIMGYQSASATWIITLFMFLAGGNFALQYRVLFQGKIRALLHNEEFRLYATIVVLMSLLLCAALVVSGTAAFQRRAARRFFPDCLDHHHHRLCLGGFRTLGRPGTDHSLYRDADRRLRRFGGRRRQGGAGPVRAQIPQTGDRPGRAPQGGAADQDRPGDRA